MWGADWKFRHEGNCLTSRGLPSDDEQLHEWRNFQVAPKNHYGFFFLHTLPSTIAFRLECVLFYHFYAKITTFFDQEKFGTTPVLYVDVETFGGKLMWKWRQDFQNEVKTSKSSYWRHARETSYTPHVRRHFLAPVGFTEILVGYARIQSLPLLLRLLTIRCRIAFAMPEDLFMSSVWGFHFFAMVRRSSCTPIPSWSPQKTCYTLDFRDYR